MSMLFKKEKKNKYITVENKCICFAFRAARLEKKCSWKKKILLHQYLKKKCANDLNSFSKRL